METLETGNSKKEEEKIEEGLIHKSEDQIDEDNYNDEVLKNAIVPNLPPFSPRVTENYRRKVKATQWKNRFKERIPLEDMPDEDLQKVFKIAEAKAKEANDKCQFFLAMLDEMDLVARQRGYDIESKIEGR